MEEQLEYLRKITDDFGIIQFSNKNKPNIKSEYTLDDNARALIVASKLNLPYLPEIYLNFIKNSQTKDGRFINVFSGNKEPLEEIGSQDSRGRTIWALGEYLKINSSEKAEEIASKSLEGIEKFPFEYPISESFAIMGLVKMYESGFDKSRTSKSIEKISDSLIQRIKDHSKDNWFWPSNEMSYENARIPQSLFLSFKILDDLKYFLYAEKTTRFLDKKVFKRKDRELILNVIGNSERGLEGDWYKKGMENPPEYDEQPVDVGATVELHSEAHKIKEKHSYHLDRAKISFDWFNGKNRLNQKMISSQGGIYDGLGKDYVNPNQGAESLLAYMMAEIQLNLINKE